MWIRISLLIIFPHTGIAYLLIITVTMTLPFQLTATEFFRLFSQSLWSYPWLFLSSHTFTSNIPSNSPASPSRGVLIWLILISPLLPPWFKPPSAPTWITAVASSWPMGFCLCSLQRIPEQQPEQILWKCVRSHDSYMVRAPLPTSILGPMPPIQFYWDVIDM